MKTRLLIIIVFGMMTIVGFSILPAFADHDLGKPNYRINYIVNHIATVSDESIQVAFKVTETENCHGNYEYGEGHYEWINESCIVVDCPNCKRAFEKYTFAPPLKQQKAGVSMIDIQCNDGKHLEWKVKSYQPICVSYDTSNELIHRGVILLRIVNPGWDIHETLCDLYDGKIEYSDEIKGIEPTKYCSNLAYPILCNTIDGDLSENNLCTIPIEYYQGVE